MKKIILTIVTSLLLYGSVYAEDKKVCLGRFGFAFADINTLHEYVDLDCNDLWDTVLEFKKKSNKWTYTGSFWDCPE